MARCTRCGGEMGPTEPKCPHCGYDFPAPATGPPDFAWSRLADVALLVGQGAAFVGVVLGVPTCAVSLIRGDWVEALVYGPVVVLVLLAMFVVFARVRHIPPP